ncbi:MAG: phosphotransferase, partial [Acidobacteriota bacterium]|nr:phosphotransferase [Acidobacteriota bacterium]
ALLTDQYPDLTTRPLTAVGAGWANVIYRLGPHFSVRLPRRHAVVERLGHEQRWLPQLASRCEFAAPALIRIGTPSSLSPWRGIRFFWCGGTD